MSGQPPIPIDVNQIDWNEVWKVKKQRMLSTPHYLDSEAFWSRKKSVDRLYSTKSGQSLVRVSTQLEALPIYPGTRVLDIGSGPGTLAIPLAKAGCEVTAVEPSEAMVALLEDNRAYEKAGEIRIIRSRWEDIHASELAPPYDLVIASFSLSMLDIWENVKKMNDLAGGSVYLFWFLTPPVWARVMHDLWERVHGSIFHFGPTADCLYQVLLQNNIYANLVPEPSPHTHIYSTIDDAVEDFMNRMNCIGKREESVIRKYLSMHLSSNQSGYHLQGKSWNARIWWETRRE